MKNKRVLVTGASGFIGTNILSYLILNGFTVLNVDVCPPKNKNHQIYWQEIDITDLEAFKKCIVSFSPDYILHLAARTDLEGKKIDDYSANTVGVRNLMCIIKELPNLKKIVVTSSMLVCRTGYSPKNQFDYAPSTLYGESKVKTENIIWENKPLCDWAILRPTSIWGPWFGIPYKNFFDMVISRKYFHIGKQSCTKTYGYIGNAVYQIMQILFSETIDEKNKVFYIGDKPATDIEEWANEISNELNYKILRIPFCLVQIAAVLGDCLKALGISFPMSSFRLYNMTTNNIVDLDNTYKVAPNPPYSRIEGIKKTINWINNESIHNNGNL